MMKVLIGTNNQGKVEGAKQAFEKFYKNVEITGVSVNSDVSDEPVKLENTKGGIAHLTNGVITRYDLTREAFIMALTEFVNGDIWKD